MFKYYMFAFVKANLLTLLIIIYMFILDFGEISLQYHWKIWLIINAYFQCNKVSYQEAERIEDKWTFIRLTEGKKWYHRYFDSDIKKRLK